MVVSEKGFWLARSNGAFETRLDIVSPQVVPRPGRSGAGSKARPDFFAGAERLASARGAALSALAPAALGVLGAGVAGGGAGFASSLLKSRGALSFSARSP